MTVEDAALAERLLVAALGGEPSLSASQIADLMLLASEEEDGVVVYPARRLQSAASLGWQWKSALTADKYDLGGGQGKSLTESQWFDHCMRMGAAYATGQMSVVGDLAFPGGISSIKLTTGLAPADPPEGWLS